GSSSNALCIAAGLRLRTTLTATTAEHLHLLANDLGAVSISAGFLVLPLSCFQTAFDVNGSALLEIFANNLSQAVVEDHAVPFSVFSTLTGCLVFPTRSGSNRNIGNCGTVGGIANFRIAAQVADQND